MKPLTEKALNIAFHQVAFLDCVAAAETLLRRWPSNEVAMLIAEDRDEVRDVIKRQHRMCQQDNLEFLRSLGSISQIMPLQKRRDTVHFTHKLESKALQLADICCFIIKGYLTRHPHNRRLFEALRPQILFFAGDVPAEEQPR
jgi:hypothetical protein